MKKDLVDIRASLDRLGKDRISMDKDKKSILLALRRIEQEQTRLEKKISNSQKQMKEILDGKEALLREVHHRVKNNLQVISSLLRLQSTTIKDPFANQKFTESCNRIRAMAMVHEKLYLKEDFSNVDIKEYIESLLKYLESSYSVPGKKIKLVVEIAIRSSQFKIDEAIPLGLILNELLSNAYKYAFPDVGKGTIRVALAESKDKAGVTYKLEVSDDGCGLPQKVSMLNTATLGLQLVSLLTEQLAGKLKIVRKPGTWYSITFRKSALFRPSSSDYPVASGR
jgi:two-component sensor histidine kinase